MPVLTKMIGFLVTSDSKKATTFYRDVLGFRLMGEDEHAVVFDANGTMLRVNKGRDFKPAHPTVLGWEVDDIHAAIRELASQGGSNNVRAAIARRSHRQSRAPGLRLSPAGYRRW